MHRRGHPMDYILKFNRSKISNKEEDEDCSRQSSFNTILLRINLSACSLLIKYIFIPIVKNQ
jgi:hypothetical protein